MTRVWDGFLTERDKRHLAAGWQKRVPFGLGQQPALLVVDNFDSVVGPTRESVVSAVVADPTRCGEEGWDALAATGELLNFARSVRCPVVHTTIRRPVRTGIFGRLPESVQRDGYAFHQTVLPADDELIVVKPHASAFFGTGLAAHLVTMGVDTILLCGNSTSGCIRATGVDAAQHGFRLAVIEDCTFDRTEAAHAMSLFDLDQKYGDVMSVSAVRAYLESLQG